MTYSLASPPAILLVDDDFHSARLLSRMVAAHCGPSVDILDGAEAALPHLRGLASVPAVTRCLVVVDLKSSSTATRDFIAKLKAEAPSLMVVAMAPSLDRVTRDALHDAGAVAVFERHADITLYRREAASLVAFWVRHQHLDAVGA